MAARILKQPMAADSNFFWKIEIAMNQEPSVPAGATIPDSTHASREMGAMIFVQFQFSKFGVSGLEKFDWLLPSLLYTLTTWSLGAGRSDVD